MTSSDDPIQELETDGRTEVELPEVGGTNTYHVWTERAAGPAPNVVEVWKDHQDEFEVEERKSDAESVMYVLVRREDDR